MLPGAVCAAAALLGWVVGRRSTRGRDAILALGVAAAFVAAMFALEMGPSFPLGSSQDGWLWVVWIAVGGAVVAWFETCVPVALVVKIVVRTAVAIGFAWLLMSPLVLPWESRRPLFALGVALATLGLWSALADGRVRASRVSLAGPILVTLPAAAGILVLFGHSVKMGLAAGALGVAVGATAVFGWSRKTSALLPAAAAAVIAPVFVGLLSSAFLYLNYGETVGFPLVVGVLLVASAASCGVRSWKVALILAVLFAGGAALVAGVNDARNGPLTEGW